MDLGFRVSVGRKGGRSMYYIATWTLWVRYLRIVVVGPAM